MDARLKPMLNDPTVAYLDRKYLDSEAGRPVRILAEYLQPLHSLARRCVVL